MYGINKQVQTKNELLMSEDERDMILLIRSHKLNMDHLHKLVDTVYDLSQEYAKNPIELISDEDEVCIVAEGYNIRLDEITIKELIVHSEENKKFINKVRQSLQKPTAANSNTNKMRSNDYNNNSAATVSLNHNTSDRPSSERDQNPISSVSGGSNEAVQSNTLSNGLESSMTSAKVCNNTGNNESECKNKPNQIPSISNSNEEFVSSCVKKCLLKLIQDGELSIVKPGKKSTIQSSNPIDQKEQETPKKAPNPMQECNSQTLLSDYISPQQSVSDRPTGQQHGRLFIPEQYAHHYPYQDLNSNNVQINGNNIYRHPNINPLSYNTQANIPQNIPTIPLQVPEPSTYPTINPGTSYYANRPITSIPGAAHGSVYDPRLFANLNEGAALPTAASSMNLTNMPHLNAAGYINQARALGLVDLPPLARPHLAPNQLGAERQLN